MFAIDKDTNNITLTRGDTGAFGVAVVDYELEDGDTVYLTVAKTKEANAADVVISKSTTTFDEGIASFEIASADTIGLECKSYYYDIQIDASDGTVATPIVAKFKITQGVKKEEANESNP